MTDHRVPDLMGEIIGWRAWRVIGGRPEKLPMLASATYGDTIWHPGYWTPATCSGRSECSRSLDGRVPGEECSCGLYAAKDRSQLVGLPYGRQDGRRPKIVGEVGLAGKVIPGSQGWRGEKGRIVRLYVPFQLWRLVTPLEELYQVEAVLDNTQKKEQTRIGGGE